LSWIGKEGKPLESRDKALAAAGAAVDKKARDVLVLDLQGLTTITDYFVICSGESTTQIKAIAEEIEERFHAAGVKPLGVEGLSHSHWVLMDYNDVIIHIFEEETRKFYELEKLWIDAERIRLE
jgi:ribosome-associated protein